jgi:hypothetical protein
LNVILIENIEIPWNVMAPLIAVVALEFSLNMTARKVRLEWYVARLEQIESA